MDKIQSAIYTRCMEKSNDFVLKKIENDQFEEFWQMLTSSFPSDEYRTKEDHFAMLSNPLHTVWAAASGENIFGFVTTWDIGNFLYVEHLVTSPKFRNMGLGSKILQKLASLATLPICLEVEPPVTEMATRRIEFYKRNGYFLNTYRYFQPPYGSDKQPLELLIMTYPRAITRLEFDDMKSSLYPVVYNVSKDYAPAE